MLLADYNKGLIVTLHVLLVWCHVSWGNYLPRNNRRKFVRVDNEDRFRSPRIVILGKAYLTDFLMMMICFYFLNAFLYGCVTIQKYASEIIEFIKHKVVMMTFFKCIQEFHLKATEMSQF